MTKIIIFGTSYVNTFITLKSSNFKIMKFKGAMIKGLINKNENYQKIVDELKYNSYDYAIFMFGDPDCNFYYFKKKYVDNLNGKTIDSEFNKYIKEYVKLISELSNIKNKYILGASPPSIIDDDIFKICLKGYGVLDEEHVKKVNDKDLKYKNRIVRFKNFNNILEKSCSKYNINFCSVYNLIINSKGKLDNLFRIRYNSYNIHYNFEAVLIVYINTCFNFLIKLLKTNYKEIINNTKQTWNNYIIDLKKKYNINTHSNLYILDIKGIEKFVASKMGIYTGKPIKN